MAPRLHDVEGMLLASNLRGDKRGLRSLLRWSRSSQDETSPEKPMIFRNCSTVSVLCRNHSLRSGDGWSSIADTKRRKVSECDGVEVQVYLLRRE